MVIVVTVRYLTLTENKNGASMTKEEKMQMLVNLIYQREYKTMRNQIAVDKKK